MERSSEAQEREALLDRIRPYVDAHGVTSLKLDVLAGRLGMSLERLREFFDTKEELVVALIARYRIKQREVLTGIAADPTMNQLDRSRAMWRFALDHESDFRLLFESNAVGVRDEHYRTFVHGVDGWIRAAKAALLRDGFAAQDALAFATLALAIHRGAMMDVVATGERARVNAAMELWFRATASGDVRDS